MQNRCSFSECSDPSRHNPAKTCCVDLFPRPRLRWGGRRRLAKMGGEAAAGGHHSAWFGSVPYTVSAAAAEVSCASSLARMQNQCPRSSNNIYSPEPSLSELEWVQGSNYVAHAKGAWRTLHVVLGSVFRIGHKHHIRDQVTSLPLPVSKPRDVQFSSAALRIKALNKKVAQHVGKSFDQNAYVSLANCPVCCF